MTSNQIKQAVKKAIRGTIEETWFCENCNQDVILLADLAKEKGTCKTCKTVYPLQDSLYIDIFKDLKKQFGDAIFIG